MLSEKIKSKIDAGVLPTECPEKTFAGYGTDAPCSACDEPILRTQVEWTVQTEDASGTVDHRFHIGCHGLWVAALLKRGATPPPERSAAQRVTRQLAKYAGGLCLPCLSGLTMLPLDLVYAVLLHLEEAIKVSREGTCAGCGESDRHLVRRI